LNRSTFKDESREQSREIKREDVEKTKPLSEVGSSNSADERRGRSGM